MPGRGRISRPGPAAARRRGPPAGAGSARPDDEHDAPCAQPSTRRPPPAAPMLMTFASSYTTARDLTSSRRRAIMLLVGSRNIQGKVVGRAGIVTAATMAVLIAAIRSANAGPPPDPPLALLGFAAIYLAPAALRFIRHPPGAGPAPAAAA